MANIIKTNKNEKYLILLICFIVSFTVIKNAFISTIRSFAVLPLKLDTVFIYLIFIIIGLLSIREVISRLKLDFIFIYFIPFSSFLLAWFINNSYSQIFTKVGINILITIPCYILTRTVRNYDKLLKYLNYFAFLIAASSAIIIIGFKVNQDIGYSQYTSYLTLPAAIISANTLFKKINIYHLINLIGSIILIFFSGTRGPLICFLLFIVTRGIIWFIENKKLTVKIPITILFIVTILFFNTFLNNLYHISNEYGYSARLSKYLEKGNILEDIGRIELIKLSIDIIGDNPLFGTGPVNDRIILSRLVGYPDDPIGWYPHNIFLEIYLDYGIILGSIIIIALCYFTFKALSTKNCGSLKYLVVIFLSIGLYPLLFSGSYLESRLFFAFVGFIVSANKRNNKRTTHL